MKMVMSRMKIFEEIHIFRSVFSNLGLEQKLEMVMNRPRMFRQIHIFWNI